jgi:benzoylformate decarboxylase
VPTGAEVLIEVLVTEGVRHVFGNPGSTELPLLAALARHAGIDYVLGLQEATVVGMADGYAQASGRPAFVNLHSLAGLGNAAGNLANARANQAPLVVTAGNADRRHLVADPLLSGDLPALAAPLSRWAVEARHAAELGTLARRAFHDAAGPPAGPVFLSIPCDVLDEPAPSGAPPRTVDRGPGPAAGLDELARLLRECAPGTLGIVAADDVAAGGATGALVALAEVLGAPVHAAPLHGRRVFPADHPLYVGPLPPRADAIRAALGSYRRVLHVGGQAFLVYPYTPGSPVPAGTELLHLSPDPAQLGRAHPASFAASGDLATSLAALAELVAAEPPPGAAAALAAAGEARAAARRHHDDLALARYGESPMHPMAAVHALVRALPAESVVVDEAITAGAYVRGFHRTAGPHTYWFCRGGGLGWGMPAACGISLALGREPVLCVVGDGSAMYAPQALWTAAHLGLPVVFAVVDNGAYQILKRNQGAGPYVGMDLAPPALGFCELARSMGVPATSVEKAPDLPAAVAAVWGTGPHLLHLPVAAAP